MNQDQAVARLLQKKTYDFNDLREITRILRSEEGCPWDREQTHKSIRNCMIEEAYEVVEAIDTENTQLLREELGDVLFQVMFHSQIEFEKHEFSVEDVVNDICVKMIRRHPHVFSDVQAADAEDVLRNWESIKTEEKQRTTLASRLRAVPPMLPALMRAAKIAKKAGLTETDENSGERICELAKRLVQKGEDRGSDTLGELLMAVSVYAEKAQMDAEQALGQAIEREISRFEVEKEG